MDDLDRIPKMSKWIRITHKNSCFSIVSVNSKIIRAAPIAKWTIGKKEAFILAYFKAQGATIEYLS
jgi:hypothetical protein